MTGIVSILASKLEALGWMLCHSAWQFTLLWLILVGVDRLARSCDSRIRYMISCTALGLVFVTAIGTTAVFWNASVPEIVSRAVTPTGDPSQLYNAFHVQFDGIDSAVRGIDSIALWFSLVWVLLLTLRCVGVIFTAMWLPAWVKRRSKACRDLPPRWVRLAESLVPNRRVTFRESSAMESPLTIGWLRPIIVLPTAVIAGVPAAHVEAVVAHELAHIRRRDYLVNLLQSIADAVFFYHPCVHLISRRIRQLREECCDDLAVEALGGAKCDYIDAILSVEELRASSLRLALGVAGGSLLQRVRRLAQPLVHPHPGRVRRTIGAAMLVLGVLFMATSYSAYGYVAEQRLIANALNMTSSQSVYELLGELGENHRLPAVLEANGPAVVKKILPTDDLLRELESAFEGGTPYDVLMLPSIVSYDPDHLIRPRSDGWRGGSWSRHQKLALAIFERAKSEHDSQTQRRYTRIAVLLAAQESLDAPASALWIIIGDPRFENASGWTPERVYQLRLILSAHNSVLIRANLACVTWAEAPSMPIPELVKEGVRLYPRVAWQAAHAVRNLKRDSAERNAIIAELEQARHAAGPTFARQLRSDTVWRQSPSSILLRIVPEQGPPP